MGQSTNKNILKMVNKHAKMVDKMATRETNYASRQMLSSKLGD